MNTKGFCHNARCKKCGRWRRLKFQAREFSKPDPSYQTVIEKDGIAYAAGAVCGLCAHKQAIDNARRALQHLLNKLPEKQAHADAMDAKYRPTTAKE